MLTIYKRIVAKIAEHRQIFLDANVTPVKMIDIYQVPPDDEDFGELLLPTLLLDHTLDWENRKAYIDVHCLYFDTGNTDNLKLKLSETGLRYLVFLDVVKMVLTGMTTYPGRRNRMKLVGESKASASGIRYHVLRFECGVDNPYETNNVNMPQFVNPPSTPSVNVSKATALQFYTFFPHIFDPTFDPTLE